MDTPENPNRPPERVIELSRRQWLLVRVVIALLFGSVITIFSLAAGYNEALQSTERELYPLGPDLTYAQFMTLPQTQDAIQSAWVTGILAAILGFISVRPRPLTRRSRLGLIVRIGLTLLAAVYVGEIITIGHIPTGH